MAGLQDLMLRTRRAAIVGELIGTFESVEDRHDLIRHLRDAELISPTTADMLLEVYGLEGA